MRFCYASIVAAGLLRLGYAMGTGFAPALDLILKHHGSDAVKLGHTLQTLTIIATKLRDEPEDRKYRNIRLLNKTFWDRVGSVNGGISFMTALGFDLVEQGAGQGPSFQVRAGAPIGADLALALELLSAKTAPKASQPRTEELNDEEIDTEDIATASEGGGGFNPFATAFSRRSRTHLQQRAEEGLASWERGQARLQQRFRNIEDRHITVLLPQATQSRERNGPGDDSVPNLTIGEDSESDLDERDELEIVMRLWRERHTKDEPERFETKAAKKLRVLRATKTYPYVLVRVRLPDGLYLQARFNLGESLMTVYEVIGASLEAEATTENANSGFCHNFELFLAGPTRVLERDGTSLRDANLLAPACVVHLRWDEEHTGAEYWGPKLEDAIRTASGDARHPRVSYSSRYDVPEPVSSRRVLGAGIEPSLPTGAPIDSSDSGHQ